MLPTTLVDLLPLGWQWSAIALPLFKSLPLLLIVWLLHALLQKRQPQWRAYLWRASAVALLLLPLIGLIELPVLRHSQLPALTNEANTTQTGAPEAAYPLQGQSTQAEQGTQHQQDGETDSALHLQKSPAIAEKNTTATAHAATAEISPDNAAGNTAATTEASAAAARFWKVAVLVWGLGVVALGARILAGARMTRKLVRQASDAPLPIRQLAQTLATEAGIRRMPQVRITSALESPALCNTLAPVLLLPRHIAAQAGSDALRAIISHELAHLKGKDLMWNLLLQLCAALYWPNPLVWRMRVAHLGACELLADAASARTCGDADAYSQVLATVALAANGSHKSPGLAMARGGNVLHRIRRLPLTLAQAPLKRHWLASALAAFVLIAIATGSTPVARAKPESAPADAAPVADLSAQADKHTKQTDTGTAPADGHTAQADDGAAPADGSSAAADARSAQANESAAQTITGATAPVSAQQAGQMNVRIVGAAGEPLENAKLHTRYEWKKQKPVTAIEQTAQGEFRIILKVEPEMPGTLFLNAQAPGYVPMVTSWSPLDKDAMPLAYTFEMKRQSRIGGRVVDAEGRGVAGATVKVGIYQQGYDSGVAYPNVFDYPVKTDADGVWSCDQIPANTTPEILSLQISAPGYAPQGGGYHFYSSQGQERRDMIAKLREGTLVSVLQRGYSIGGRISRPDGSPAAGAQVGSGWSRNSSDGSWQTTTADEQGRYHFDNVMPEIEGKAILTVVDPGYAPTILKTPLDSNNDNLDIRLQPGNTVRIRVVDAAGKPVQGALIAINTWQGVDSLFGKAPTRQFTNADGESEWLWAPAGSISYSIQQEGYLYMPSVPLSPSEQWQTVTLRAATEVKATVVDAATGEPIPLFSVKQYSTLDPNWSSYWQPYSDFNGTDGAFDITLGSFDYVAHEGQGWRIAVSAPGYIAQERIVRLDQPSPVPLRYALEPGTQTSGIVVAANGKPVANAEVVMIPRGPGQRPITINNTILHPNTPVAAKATTAADGSFSLPPSNQPATLLVLLEDGYAISRLAEGSNDPLRLTLAPWGQVLGKLALNPGQSTAQQRMILTMFRPDDNGVIFTSTTMTDAGGTYHFPRLAAGAYRLFHTVEDAGGGYGSSGPGLNVQVQPGADSVRNYDARGVNVVGKINWQASGANDTLEPGSAYLTAVTPATVLAAMPAADTGHLSYRVFIDKDGHFRSSGVLPGQYKAVFLMPQRGQSGPAALFGNRMTAEEIITVPAANPGETFDTGTIRLNFANADKANAADSQKPK